LIRYLFVISLSTLLFFSYFFYLFILDFIFSSSFLSFCLVFALASHRGENWPQVNKNIGKKYHEKVLFFFQIFFKNFFLLLPSSHLATPRLPFPSLSQRYLQELVLPVGFSPNPPPP